MKTIYTGDRKYIQPSPCVCLTRVWLVHYLPIRVSHRKENVEAVFAVTSIFKLDWFDKFDLNFKRKICYDFTYLPYWLEFDTFCKKYYRAKWERTLCRPIASWNWPCAKSDEPVPSTLNTERMKWMKHTKAFHYSKLTSYCIQLKFGYRRRSSFHFLHFIFTRTATSSLHWRDIILSYITFALEQHYEVALSLIGHLADRLLFFLLHFLSSFLSAPNFFILFFLKKAFGGH